MMAPQEGAELKEDSYSPAELEHLKRSTTWNTTGRGYMIEHGTRPATVGLALSSSPLALLAW